MARVKNIPLFSNTPAATRQQPMSSSAQQQKALAEMLMSGQPARIHSTGEGILSAGATMFGGLLARKAADTEKREEENAWSEIMRTMTENSGLGDAPSSFASPSTETSGRSQPSFGGSARSGGSGGGSRAFAANERKTRAVQRLVGLGYSQHAAEGVADNLMHESGFNTKAVGDNGTAFGLAQWRGPRFANLKKFAASRGKDWHDFDTQVDFVDHEMKNRLDEGAGIAYAKLQAAGDADSAYDAFVTHYERPSAANLRKRLRGGNNFSARPQQTAQAPASSRAPQASAGLSELPPLDLSAQRDLMRRGMALMRHPNMRSQGWQMYQQGMSEIRQLQQAYRTKQIEFARDGEKFNREADLRREGWDRDDWRQEQKIILEAEQEAAKWDRERQAKEEDPYTLTPGSVRFKGREKIAEVPKVDSNADIEVGADGSIKLKTGKLTEGQSKDIGFYDRGAAAELELREREEALTDWRSKNLGATPYVGNYMKSPEYRQAEVPARQFLASLLRKDTGAAVTDHEFDLYGNMFLPVPGDDAETLRLKRGARLVALRSIKKGLGTAEALAEAHPELFDGKSLQPKAKAPAPGKPAPKDNEPMPPGISEEDRKLWPFMDKEGRELLRRHYGRS